jgi:sugar phosphate isomerase/epimerase
MLGYALKNLILFDENMKCFQDNSGYDHLELTVDNVDDNAIFYSKVLQNKVMKLKKRNDFSLSVHSYGAINLAEKVNRLRKTCTTIQNELLDISEELGAEYFVLHLGYCGFHSNSLKKEKRLNLVINELKYLLDVIKDYNIKLAIENSILLPYNKYKSYLGDSIEDFNYIFTRVEDEKLNMVFDIGHYNVNNSGLHEEFIQRFENKIIAYHVHWNDGLSDQHLPITKEWKKQYSGLYEKLRSEAKKGKIIIFENHTTDEAYESRKIFTNEG